MEVLGLGGQRGGIGGCGGGELEHPRQLRGTQWPGLFSWEQQAAQRRCGALSRAALEHAARPRRLGRLGRLWRLAGGGGALPWRQA